MASGVDRDPGRIAELGIVRRTQPHTLPTDAGHTRDDASSVEQVSEVYSTSGQYDLLMKCYLDEKVDIGHFVTSQIQTLANVKDTFTIITFKAFS